MIKSSSYYIFIRNVSHFCLRIPGKPEICKIIDVRIDFFSRRALVFYSTVTFSHHEVHGQICNKYKHAVSLNSVTRNLYSIIWHPRL